MLNYFIEKITIRGSERKDAVIELQKGLNIISGPSNTGKTSIVKAIDFLYGTDKADAPFSISATGYNQVEMVINTKDGRYSLKRKFDENKIYVYLLDSENTHQLYGEYNARTGNSVISQFWLNLIGISDPQQIIKNKDFIKQNLSWRTFSSSTLIQQSKIDSETSVLLPDVHSSQTAFLSALLFLFDGDQFSDTEENETDEQRKIRR
ncbi:AAA family ATPase, partial [Listeria monocytogenes]|nr:AAA family ATPase [Listeria monocytogenes]